MAANDLAMVVVPADDLAMMWDTRGLGVVVGLLPEGVADDLAMLVEPADDLGMMRDARGLGVVGQEGVADDLAMSAVPADDLAMLVESADDLTMMRDARGLGVVDGLLQEGVADDLAMLLEPADDLEMTWDARGPGVVVGLLQEGMADDLAMSVVPADVLAMLVVPVDDLAMLVVPADGLEMIWDDYCMEAIDCLRQGVAAEDLEALAVTVDDHLAMLCCPGHLPDQHLSSAPGMQPNHQYCVPILLRLSVLSSINASCFLPRHTPLCLPHRLLLTPLPYLSMSALTNSHALYLSSMLAKLFTLSQWALSLPTTSLPPSQSASLTPTSSRLPSGSGA